MSKHNMEQNHVKFKCYEGFIESIGADSFIARLVDQDNPIELNLEVEILLEEVPLSERAYVKVLTVFNLII